MGEAALTADEAEELAGLLRRETEPLMARRPGLVCHVRVHARPGLGERVGLTMGFDEAYVVGGFQAADAPAGEEDREAFATLLVADLGRRLERALAQRAVNPYYLKRLAREKAARAATEDEEEADDEGEEDED